MQELWPINPSITGEGVRQTLDLIQKHIPNLEVNSVPSGTQVFDWTVPKEWTVKAAYIMTPSGEKICDFDKNNLHLLGYSIPFEGEMDLDDLKKHLYTLPEQRNAIPYITSYYKERWGFCMTQDQYDDLKDGLYYIKIDSKKLFEGVLNYGEILIKGQKYK